MALSFENVQKAYRVFAEFKKTILPDLEIKCFAEDMADFSEKERENPKELKVYGFDRKLDGGWENLVFFVENPTENLKVKFDELKHLVGNSSMAEPYNDNSNLWVFGWF